MAKGATAGVLVLCGVAGFVLVSIAATSVYFVYRGRMVARQNQVDAALPPTVRSNEKAGPRQP